MLQQLLDCVLQRHKPGELQEAEERVNYTEGHCVLHNHLNVLKGKGGPPTLFVGASHVNHLKSYVSQCDPNGKARLAFSNSFFAGVGGTTFAKIQDDLKGIDLNENQAYLEDQWTDLLDSGFTPSYIVIICGSNDTDKIHNKINCQCKAWPRSMFRKYAENTMKSSYEKITENIDSLMLLLHETFPEARFLYSKILPRCWWGVYARTYARWIDNYIISRLNRRYRVKEIWARDVFTAPFHLEDCVHFGMLRTDMIHLNNNGNKALISAIMKPLLHLWKFAPKVEVPIPE